MSDTNAIILVPLKKWIELSLAKGIKAEFSKVLSDISNCNIEKLFFFGDMEKLQKLYDVRKQIARLKIPNAEIGIIDTSISQSNSDYVDFCCIEEIFKFVTSHSPEEYHKLAIFLANGDNKFVKTAQYIIQELHIPFLVLAPEGTVSEQFYELSRNDPNYLSIQEFSIESDLSDFEKKNIIKFIISYLESKQDITISFQSMLKHAISALRITDIQFSYIFDNLVKLNIIEKYDKEDAGKIYHLIRINLVELQKNNLRSNIEDLNFTIPF